MANKYINVYMEDFEDIDPKVLSQLRKLNSGEYGRMRSNIRSFYNQSSCDDGKLRIPKAKAYYIMGKDKEIKSWAMVYSHKYFYDKKTITLIDFYTKKPYRGKGLASTIASVIKKDYRNKTLYGAAEASTIFKRYGIIS